MSKISKDEQGTKFTSIMENAYNRIEPIQESSEYYVLYRVTTNPTELDHLEKEKTVFGKDFGTDCSKLDASELNKLSVKQVGLNENAHSKAQGIKTPFTSFTTNPKKGFASKKGNYIAVLIPKDKVNLYTKGTKYEKGKQPLIAGEPSTNEMLVPNGVPIKEVAYFVGGKKVDRQTYNEKVVEKQSKKQSVKKQPMGFRMQPRRQQFGYGMNSSVKKVMSDNYNSL